MNPLIFYALALLITEPLLYGFRSDNVASDASYNLIIAGIMAGLFLSVVAIVTYLTISTPENLYEQIKPVVEQETKDQTKDLREELYLTLYESGWEYTVHMEAKAAREKYAKAIKLLPRRPEAYSGLATILAQETDLDQALKMAEEGVELSKGNDPNAFVARAEVYSRRKDFDMARTDLDTARKLNIEKKVLAFSEGNYLFDKGDYGLAERAYTEALTKDENYFRAYYNRACCRSYLNKFDEALADLKHVLFLNPRIIPFALRDPDFNKLRDAAEYRYRLEMLLLIR